MSVNDRSSRISKLLRDKKSRTSYIKAKLGALVPGQIRALRLKSNMPRQSDLARAAGMHQSRISMFETPGANLTLDTLARLAATFKVGLVVKFVPFSEMLSWENNFSQDHFDPVRIDKDQAFLNPSRAVVANPPWAIALPSDLPTGQPPFDLPTIMMSYGLGKTQIMLQAAHSLGVDELTGFPLTPPPGISMQAQAELSVLQR